MMVWLKLKGSGSVRCVQNPNCRGQLSTKCNQRGNNCEPCGWWWRSRWRDKYNDKVKVVEVKFLQDRMIEKGFGD